MKKILFLAMIFAIGINQVYARDYAELQIKEMKHAQKYGTTKQYLNKKNINYANQNLLQIKDPKIIKICNYNEIPEKKYEAKLQADEKQYKVFEKELSKKSLNKYKTQANGEDYYKVYRVAEKIIRANNLDYLNWRIEIYKDSKDVNAYTSNTNFIAISTALFDTFSENEDALALVIGHEMGHALLGHAQRKQKIVDIMNHISYNVGLIKYRIESKNMEYAADAEGAKLAFRAGYDLNAASEVMRYFGTLPREKDWRTTHPDPNKRLKNINDNAKYFPNDWTLVGKENIYNSDVLKVRLSSDRKSMVISASDKKENKDGYFALETLEELYTRLAYMNYLDGKFAKAIKYFDKLFEIDKTNAAAYLYASYASEYLYNNTKNSKYLELAKDYANKGYQLDSKNKFIKEQVDSL